MILNILSQPKQGWRDFVFIKKLKQTETFYDFQPNISL
jgi:hypothetical protein